MARIAWYDWQNLRKRLTVFGRALQGASPYRVLIESDPARCATGYCNFTRRIIAVNPAAFPDLRPRAAFEVTKALLVHEAGHRRFTTPLDLPRVVHLVVNILEDERIERAMADEFAGVRHLLGLLRTKLYADSPGLKPTDDPGQILAASLQYRWANALGQPLKGALSELNQRRWERVRPLVEHAWEAPDTREVERLARQIVEILDLHEDDVPDWVRELSERLGEVVGTRQAGDAAETRDPGEEEDHIASPDDTAEPEPFDGELPPGDHPAGTGAYAIEPKPYRTLEERAEPLARALIAELAIVPTTDLPAPSERGGRMLMRQLVRDHRHPFLAPEDERLAPVSLALRIVVDHSTSMNIVTTSGRTRTRIESVAEAALALHLAGVALEIPHAIAVTPQQVVLADNASGERGKALLAGLVPARTSWEDLAKAIVLHRRALLAIPATRRVLLVLHDGWPNDAEVARGLCAERSPVEIIGVLLDPDDGTRAAMASIFRDRLIACPSGELPGRLGTVLRNLGKG
jgi:nitric oxide reductase activation protein